MPWAQSCQAYQLGSGPDYSPAGEKYWRRGWIKSKLIVVRQLRGLRLEAKVSGSSAPGWGWRAIRLMNRRLAKVAKPWQRRGDLVLALTTKGRKTGRPHVTPLQYEQVNDLIYVSAARGQQADWFRNLVANPQVEVEMEGGRFLAQAEPITDPVQITDFLELRLERHPKMIRAMLLLHGLSSRTDREKLERLAEKLALVALQPVTD